MLDSASWLLSGVLGAIAAVVAAGLFLKLRQDRGTRSLQTLPSPPGNWLWGNTLDVLTAAKKGQLAPLVFEWSQQLGEIFAIWNLGNPLVVVSNPQAIEEILVKGQGEGTFQRDPKFYRAYEDVFGTHIGNQVGEEWKWRRQAWSSSFNPNHFYDRADIFVDYAKRTIQQIETQSDSGEIVTVDPLFSKLTMDIFGYFLLGITSEDTSNTDNLPPFDSEKIAAALGVLEKVTLLQGTTQVSWLKDLPNQQGKLYRQAQNYLAEVLLPYIELALESAGKIGQNSTSDRASTSPAFQESMVAKLARNPKYTEPKQLLAEVKAALFAGHDTTAHTMTFAMGELALNPSVFAKARDIADSVLAKFKTLDRAALKELSYIEAIVKETMRLHPVVTGVPLIATRETTVAGVSIPANTTVRPSFSTAGYNAKMYREAASFSPDRWLQNAPDSDEKILLFGFSLGPHICLGAAFALLEATIVLTLLLHHFDWELVRGRVSLEELEQNITVFPRDRLPVRFTVRS